MRSLQKKPRNLFLQTVSVVSTPQPLPPPVVPPPVQSDLWVDVCLPSDFSSIIGHTEAIKACKQWLLKPEKPLLLWGPSGHGKTSILTSLLKSYRLWKYNDISDDILSLKTSVLGGKPWAIVIDCLESLQVDERAIVCKLMKKPPCPVVFTSDSIFDKSMAPFKTGCELVRLFPLSHNQCISILLQASTTVNEPLSAAGAGVLAEASNNNPRGAINSFQFMKTTRKAKEQCADEDESALKDSDFSYDLFRDARKLLSGVHTPHLESMASTEPDMSVLMMQHNAHGNAASLSHLQKLLDDMSVADVYTYKNSEAAIAVSTRSTALHCRGSTSSQLQFPLYYAKSMQRKSRHKALSSMTFPRHSADFGSKRTISDVCTLSTAVIDKGLQLQHFKPTAYEALDTLPYLQARLKIIPLKGAALTKEAKKQGLFGDNDRDIIEGHIWK